MKKSRVEIIKEILNLRQPKMHRFFTLENGVYYDEYNKTFTEEEVNNIDRDKYNIIIFKTIDTNRINNGNKTEKNEK